MKLMSKKIKIHETKILSHLANNLPDVYVYLHVLTRSILYLKDIFVLQIFNADLMEM